MKIATIYTLYGRRAGAELCFEKIVESVAALDPSVEWTVFCNREALSQIRASLPCVRPVCIPDLDNQYRKAFWLEFRAARTLRRLAPDVFWIPSGCNHFPGRWNVPVLTTFLDFGEYHVPGKYSFSRMVFRKRICIPRALRRSALFTAISEFTRRDMLDLFRVPADRVRVVYLGHSTHDAPSAAPPLHLLAPLGLRPGSFFFTPGRTDYVGKGLDVLLEAFRRHAALDPQATLVLVGPQGEGHDRLLADIRSAPDLEPRIRYLGRVDDDLLSALYAGCRATVIASRFEGFGFPVLEAMERGAPVICSNAGSLPEVAGDDAWVFPSGDASALARTFGDFCAAPASLLREKAENGRLRTRRFTWSRCAGDMLSAFRDAARR